MNFKKNLCVLAILFGGTQQAIATDFDFSGTFHNDNDVQLFNFTVGVDSNITIFSSSWDNGGLDPILAIFDSSGAFISEQDDGDNVGSTSSNSVSYDYSVWDTYYSQFLTAGNYIASVAQFANFHAGPNLSDGFMYAANPNFTSAYGCANGKFCGAGSDNRTPDWAFHILNVAQASTNTVPELSTMALLSIGLAGFGFKVKQKMTN